MANDKMKLGEGFSAQVKKPINKRKATMGFSIIFAVLMAPVAWFFGLGSGPKVDLVQESVGLSEVVGTNGTKIGGVLNIDIVRDGIVVAHAGPIKNQIVNAGETALRDCFGGTGTPTCTTVQAFRYHGIGTGSVAIAETDTGCGTELTTQYNPDNTRATGSQTNNGANIYRTVGTNTVDSAVTINEFCLMSQAATGGGTMWTRILTGAIALSSGDSLQTTYDLTIE